MQRQKSGRKSKAVIVLKEPKVALDEGVSHTSGHPSTVVAIISIPQALSRQVLVL